jgi:nucleotide-binding universal stress UspA family protein
MFKKILIASDGSEGAFKALVAALRLAHSHKAQLHMICVEETQWIPGSHEEVIGDKELADRKFAGVVAKAEAEAKHHRVKLKSHIVVGHPVPAEADAFSDKTGVEVREEVLVGNNARDTVPRWSPDWGRYHGFKEMLKGLEGVRVKGLSRRCQRRNEQTDALAQALQDHGVVVHRPKMPVVDFITRDGSDLLVTGFMGHSALYNRMIGSTTDRLVELAPCTVLVVK